MILVSWLFDKLGYMPKVTVDTSWPFPATQQDYVAPECEKPIAKRKPAAKKPKVVAKTVRKKKA
jgi:hypothetical protein